MHQAREDHQPLLRPAAATASSPVDRALPSPSGRTSNSTSVLMARVKPRSSSLPAARAMDSASSAASSADGSRQVVRWTKARLVNRWGRTWSCPVRRAMRSPRVMCRSASP
ncbi:hypothetical protein O1M54_44365 [Streptomyces diastatochromogenes]|nr:hypothetical protein [Streptomyces diastatochromogenes]